MATGPRSRDRRDRILVRSAVRARPILGGLIVVAGLVAGSPSIAREYSTRDVGGWTIAASQDKQGCFLTRTYRGSGGTTLLLGLDTDGSNRLSLLNANWSIREKDRQRLDFRLSNVSFPRHLAIGMASDGKKGFVTSFGEKFPAYFAASYFLHVARGDTPVERLALDGSSAAVTALRQCVSLQRGKSARKAHENDRDDGIPADPFASDVKQKAKK